MRTDTHSALPVAVQSIDEFAEDFDFTADDIDELMGDVAATTGTTVGGTIGGAVHIDNAAGPTRLVPRDAADSATRSPHLRSHDDEFGGSDIDEEDFALADICATQALRVSRE
jgi:hypothetical protein